MEEEKDLPISQLGLVTELDGNEIVPFAKENGNGSFLVSLLKQFVTSGINLSLYLKTLDAEKAYAKRSEIPDVSNFITTTTFNTLSEKVAQLTIAVNALKEKVDALPAMPIHDGQVYGILNGAWSAIAGVGQSVATVKAEQT